MERKNWQDFLNMPEGQEQDFDPALFREISPIVEITDTIRPVRIVVAQLPDGSDFLGALLYDRATHACQRRGRMRYPTGEKKIFPPVAWIGVPSPEDLADEKARSIKLLEAITTASGGKITAQIDLDPQASIDDLLAAFAASGVFDILQFDEKAKKAKRLA